MNKVQQKKTTSKKAQRDRRMLAKAKREDGRKPVSRQIAFDRPTVEYFAKILGYVGTELTKAAGGAS